MNIISTALIVVLVLAVAILCFLYAKLSKQSKETATDLAEKESLIKKEAIISAKEALQDEREKLGCGTVEEADCGAGAYLPQDKCCQIREIQRDYPESNEFLS